MKKWGFTEPLLFKLTCLAVVVTLLSVGVTTFFVVRSAQSSLTARIEADLAAEARLISLALEEALLHSEAAANKFLAKAAAEAGTYRRLIRITGPSGESVLNTIPAALPQEDLIQVVVPLGAQRTLYLAVAEPEIEEIKEMRLRLVRSSILVGVLVAIAAFGLAYFLNGVITDPLRDLLVAVQRLQHREFGRRVLVRSTDEVGQLSKAFNELSEMLEELFFTISDREGKLETILSSMDDGVIAVNMSRRVILANRAAAELFHLNSAEMIGKSQFEATRSEELSRLLEQTMDAKESMSKEVRLRPGSERTLAITSSPLEDQEGNSLGAVAVLRDTTSLRHLELVRQEFVANVSHELRTPLTSIKGFVETLLNGNLGDQDLLERFLGIINQETDRMIGLINDLLDLSRIEGGKQPFHKVPVDLKKVFDDALVILQSKADAKGIVVTNNIYDAVMVEGDEKLLRQVAINLIDNGIKYNREGGKVWIGAEQGLESVELIVSDNGFGIAPEHLDRIFERFYRVDKGRARHMGGTGLGLAITQHIIDKHKGAICAESRPGKGTKMRVTLQKTSQ